MERAEAHFLTRHRAKEINSLEELWANEEELHGLREERIDRIKRIATFK
jgi:hypothetical protein